MEEQFLGRRNLTADARRLQAMFGTLYGGGGAVKVDSNGISILTTTSKEDKRSYKFVSAYGDDATSIWGSHITATVNFGSLWSNAVTDRHTLLSVVGYSPLGYDAEAQIIAEHSDTSYCGVYCIVQADTTERITSSISGDPMFVVEAGKVYGKLAASATEAEDVRLQADNELTWFSSRRELKTDITPWQADRAAFLALKPCTFRPIEQPESDPIVGLIAEDVQEALPYAVSYRDGKLASWSDKQLLVTAISVIQQQQADIEALEVRIAALEARLDVG